jgi:prophage tail gpP-like protein
VPDVILTTNGITHGGWLSMKATSSLAQLSGTFSLDLTERWPGQTEKRGIKPGDSCTLLLGGELLITGWVDSVAADYSASSHQLNVRGRDRTCDLVDCCHLGPTLKWADKTLMQIVQELAQPFGIEVELKGEPKEALFKEIAYSTGDTVMSLIRKLCRQRGLMPTSLGNGKLILTGPGTERAGTSLKLGENIEAGRINLDHTNRFNLYQVKGQAKPDAKKISIDLNLNGDGEARKQSIEKLAAHQTQAAPLATILDKEVDRYRPLVMLAEAPGDQASMELRAGLGKVQPQGPQPECDLHPYRLGGHTRQTVAHQHPGAGEG